MQVDFASPVGYKLPDPVRSLESPQPDGVEEVQ